MKKSLKQVQLSDCDKKENNVLIYEKPILSKRVLDKNSSYLSQLNSKQMEIDSNIMSNEKKSKSLDTKVCQICLEDSGLFDIRLCHKCNESVHIDCLSKCSELKSSGVNEYICEKCIYISSFKTIIRNPFIKTTKESSVITCYICSKGNNLLFDFNEKWYHPFCLKALNYFQNQKEVNLTKKKNIKCCYCNKHINRGIALLCNFNCGEAFHFCCWLGNKEKEDEIKIKMYILSTKIKKKIKELDFYMTILPICESHNKDNIHDNAQNEVEFSPFLISNYSKYNVNKINCKESEENSRGITKSSHHELSELIDVIETRLDTDIAEIERTNSSKLNIQDISKFKKIYKKFVTNYQSLDSDLDEII